MENAVHIIGVDLSKKSIDLASNVANSHLRIKNSKEGFKKMLLWFAQLRIKRSEIMIVMEHTGLYGYCLEQFLNQNGIPFCKVNALEIKRSIGLVRGKSDKVDSFRIAQYGAQKKDKLRPEGPTGETLQRLKMLN